jgi:hypothetical protein
VYCRYGADISSKERPLQSHQQHQPFPLRSESEESVEEEIQWGRQSISDDEKDDEEVEDDDEHEDDDGEEDQVLHRREEELQAELMLATKRCQELKQTLQITKSFIESKAASQGSMYPLAGSLQQLRSGEGGQGDQIIEESDDEGDSEELEEVMEYDEDEENEIGVTIPLT